MQRWVDSVYVLHCMAYQDHHAIVKALSQQHGLISGLVRGVYQKTAKGQKLRAVLQLGSQLEWQWQGDYALKIIFNCEQLRTSPIKSPKKLVCVSYINELLLHFLAAEQKTPLYQAYADFLHALEQNDTIEIALRQFEQQLFSEMGCAIDYLWDSQNKQPIDPNGFYTIHAEQGVIPTAESPQAITGQALIHLARQDYQLEAILKLAKQVHRRIIQHHLAGKELKSRRLFEQL